MELVIMAAGMGSRFGGLKQIEPVHSNGEFILDYSIYDAIKCGFDKVVFIIKEENYSLFRDTIGKRIEDAIEVSYVFQKNDNVPKWVKLPNERTKPLGTGHAILCCKDVVKENFLVINADDFYGRDAFLVASQFIKNMKNENEFAMVGYKVGNTLTENGSVKRGVCESENGFLSKLTESTVSIENGKIICKPLNGSSEFEAYDDTLVSMNMFIFTPKIFDYLEEDFVKFFKDNESDLSKCEYLIPDVVFDLIKRKLVTVSVLKTDAVWQGITYKEDKDALVDGLNKLVNDNVYPDKLW
jgi:UTP-glucose-1-phosphate uridylyltransferase